MYQSMFKESNDAITNTLSGSNNENSDLLPFFGCKKIKQEDLPYKKFTQGADYTYHESDWPNNNTKLFPNIQEKKQRFKSKGGSNRRKLYKCDKDECGKFISGRSNLKEHQMLHNKNTTYYCEECSYSSKLSHLLSKHKQRIHSKTLNFICRWCTYRTCRVDRLKMHVKCVHDKIKNEQCSECDKCFSTKDSVKTHRILLHNQGKRRHQRHKENQMLHNKNTTYMYYCDVCNYSSKFSKLLSRHKQRIHSETLTSICRWCAYRSCKGDKLKLHVKCVHDKIKSEQCSECGKYFSTKESLKTHRILHDQSKGYLCDICHHTYHAASALIRHVNVVHNKIKDYVCEFCAKLFGSEGCLKKHQEQVHYKVRAYSCKECSYRCSTSHILKTHTQYVHIHEKKFECELCNYRGKFMQDVKMHKIRIHDMIQNSVHNFRCAQCKYSCYGQKDFVRHVETKKHIRNVLSAEVYIKPEVNDAKKEEAEDPASNQQRLIIGNTFSNDNNICDEKEINYHCKTCHYTTNFVALLDIHETIYH